MAFPDAWTETCLIGITVLGGAEVQFVPAVETVDIDAGDKDVEYIVNLKGGRIEKLTPEGDTTITFEGYFVDLDTTTNAGILQLFHTLSNSWDTAEPLEVLSDLTRNQFRVVILWTNDSAAATASGTTASNTESERFVARNCRMISCKTSFTDGMLKTTFKFKVAPRQKAGAANIKWQSGDDTNLAALSAYDSTGGGL